MPQSSGKTTKEELKMANTTIYDVSFIIFQADFLADSR
jgi:hypothetical protein